nr:hypothetical protein [uncultured Mediterranean phage uvMED]
MTAVNVTAPVTKVTVDGSTSVVTATTAGPQGIQGPAGAGGTPINGSAKVDKSVVYYDSASGEYKADATWTINTIVLGGNF